MEDEPKIAAALRDGLEAQRFEVRIAPNGEEAFFLASEQAFDLVLLDLMLPRRDGIEVLTTMRKRGLRMPVLVLTARDTVEDRVFGLNSGADDYVVKPFAFAEVLARIRALLRRGHGEAPAELECEDLRLDLLAHEAVRAGKTLELTPKEFDVLGYLVRHRGQAVSREMLARDVWRVTARATPLDNVIDVTIARLRRKLDDPFERKLLRTVRGVGFVLGPQDGN